MTPPLVIKVVGDASSLLREFGKGRTAAQSFGRSMKGLSDDVQRATSAQTQAALKLQERLKSEARAYRALADAAQKGSKEQIAAANLAVRAEERLARQLRTTTRQADSSRRAFVSLGSTVRGALAFGGITLGVASLGAAFKSTIDKAASFERTMNVLQAVSDATNRQLKQASAVAIRLGADFRLPATSAKDAGEAMLELSKAGLTLDDTMAAARGTLQLAAAANVNAAEAAQITARQLNVFQLAGSDAGRVADVLANLANVATGEITDFAIAFQQSSAVAHQFGLSIEESAGVLAELANRMGAGSDTGTSFRVMLTRLVPSTKKAADKIAELGIRWRDANGNIVPFRQQLEQYHDALLKLPAAERQLAIQTIFGQDAQRAANIVFGNSVELFDKMVAAVSRQGAASRLAAAQNKGFKGAMDGLKSAIETTQISLGTLLLPTLTKYLREGSKWLGDTRNQKRLQEDFKKTLETLGGVLKTLGGVMHTASDAFKTFSDSVGGSRNAVKLLIGAFAAFKIAGIVAKLGAIGAAAGEAGAAGEVSLLATRLNGLKTIGSIAIPITLLIAAQQATHSKTGQKFHLDDVFDFARNPVVAATNRVAGLVSGGGRNKPDLVKAGLGPLTGADAAALVPFIQSGQVTPAMLNSIKDRFADQQLFTGLLRAAKAVQRKSKLPKGFTGGGTAGTPKSVFGPTGVGSLSAATQNQIALARASTTATTSDDLRALADQRQILARQIASVTRQLQGASGENAEKLAGKLQDLYSQDASAISQIASITDANARTVKSGADKLKAAAAKRKAAEEKRRRALQETVQAALRPGTLGVKGTLSIADVNRAIRASETGRQFQALGLTTTGNERAPGVKGLQAAAASLQKGIAGTFLDTDKTKSVLAGVRRVLSGELGKLGDEMKFAVKRIIDDLDSQLKNSDVLQSRFRHISPNKLAEQLGFGGGRDATRRAAAILSQIGVGGTVPSGNAAFAGAHGGGIHFHGPSTINVRGDDTGKVEADLAKRARARPQVRRGAR